MVAPTTPLDNPRAYYGWLGETHGIFLHVKGTWSFRDSATETWQEVDRAAWIAQGVLNGRLDLIAAQALRDERFGSLYALIDYRNTEHAQHV